MKIFVFFLVWLVGCCASLRQGAMFSGIAACPLTAKLLERHAGRSVAGWAQFAIAFLIFLAGRVAVMLLLHRPFLPQ